MHCGRCCTISNLYSVVRTVDALSVQAGKDEDPGEKINFVDAWIPGYLDTWTK